MDPCFVVQVGCGCGPARMESESGNAWSQPLEPCQCHRPVGRDGGAPSTTTMAAAKQATWRACKAHVNTHVYSRVGCPAGSAGRWQQSRCHHYRTHTCGRALLVATCMFNQGMSLADCQPLMPACPQLAHRQGVRSGHTCCCVSICTRCMFVCRRMLMAMGRKCAACDTLHREGKSRGRGGQCWQTHNCQGRQAPPLRTSSSA